MVELYLDGEIIEPPLKDLSTGELIKALNGCRAMLGSVRLEEERLLARRDQIITILYQRTPPPPRPAVLQNQSLP